MSRNFLNRLTVLAHCGLIGGAVCWPALARADQTPLLPDETPQIDKRYTAVFERVQPGYEPADIPVGSLRLAPSVGISTAYDDNIYGTEQGAEADAILELTPSLELHNQNLLNNFSLKAAGTFNRYLDHSTENTDDYSVTASGLFQLDHATQVRAAVRAESDHQSRLAEDLYTQTVKPLSYAEQSAAIGISHDFDQLRVSATGKFAHFGWNNGTLADGEVVDQRTSDNTSYRVGMRVSYAQTPSLAWFASLDYNTRRFPVSTEETPSRDSQGYEALAGVTFEPTALVRGSISAGYIYQNFRLPYYKNIKGADFNVSLQYFPTQLTTITLKANRAVLDSGIPTSGGYLSSQATLRVDHEWLRQLIFSLSAGYQVNDYSNLDRRDGRFIAQANALYRINRYATLQLGYARLDQTSNGADRYRAYQDDRVTISLTLRR
ncbi:outer membrane beta-barrel protein [Novosphingobium sp. 9]|uniref:outer membrane beta-barrel protein n=1 Tax=Novosphingobium sp. 9 TaxID=2025349 RepID=UPI0021B67207|nr:outer membrane beta-barrel protein [Novosphingobium sp. 9]